MSSVNIPQLIEQNLNELSKSERKVAEIILSDPASIIHFSIAQLARSASVSEPTVNRFCHAITKTGFPEFKLQLAQSLATGIVYVSRSIEVDDTVEQYSQKLFDANLASINTAKQNINPKDIDRAVELLCQAKKIEFYGLGSSGTVAYDAQHKFVRLNTPVISYTDFLMQRMAATSCGPGDVIVLISDTGRTKATVKVAEIGKSVGATLIAITCPNSPLASTCDLVLPIEPNKDADVYTPMISRIAHFAIIDVLAVGVSLKRGPGTAKHFEKIKEALKETRFDEEEII